MLALWPLWVLPLVWQLLEKWEPGLGEEPLGDNECPVPAWGSTGAGPSGMKSLEEPELRPEGSDPEDGDEGVELDLDDEP